MTLAPIVPLRPKPAGWADQLRWAFDALEQWAETLDGEEVDRD